MKKSITYKEAQILNNMLSNYFVDNGYWDVEKKTWSEKCTKEPTKLFVNMRNIKKQVEELQIEYNEKVDDLRLDNCATDEKTGVILHTDVVGKDGQITQIKQFTPAGTKKFNKEVKELLEKEVDIHVRITEGEFNLTDEQKEHFNGILIPAFKVEADVLEFEPAASEEPK